MTTEGRKIRLIAELKDKEYRHAFVAAHITNRIAFQLRALREQREWNQEALAKEAGMKQERISMLENPNYSGISIETLKRLAKAFDVALIVGFVPFSDLAKWELNLSSESLEVVSFGDEGYFKEAVEEESLATCATQEQGLGNGGSGAVIDLFGHSAAVFPMQRLGKQGESVAFEEPTQKMRMIP